MMLEENILKLERIKEIGTKALLRATMYGVGLTFYLGMAARNGCDYIPHHYAVLGGKAVIAATTLYATSCGGESDCCESLDCPATDPYRQYNIYCNNDPPKSSQPWHCVTDDEGEEDCCACVQGGEIHSP